MKIKILKIYEKNNSLVIETECHYGKDSFGLSLDSKYLDPVTQKPKYLKEIKKHLEDRYNSELVKEKPIEKQLWGKHIDLEKI